MRKWLTPLSLCVSYSGSILLSAFLAKELVERGILGKEIAFGAFFLIVLGILVSMVLYAIKNSKRG